MLAEVWEQFPGFGYQELLDLSARDWWAWSRLALERRAYKRLDRAADRIALMDAAMLAQSKEPDAILKPYRDEYNAAIENLENAMPDLAAARTRRERARYQEGRKTLARMFGGRGRR